MKKLIFALLVALTFSSCSTMFQTSTQRDVKAPVIAAVIGDLDVSNEKVSYTYLPTAQVRRGGVQNCINCAIAEALAKGNFDVLVETQHATVERKGLFSRKITKIVVTGYPAKYKNFRNADPKALNQAIATGYVKDDSKSKSNPRSIFGFLK